MTDNSGYFSRRLFLAGSASIGLGVAAGSSPVLASPSRPVAAAVPPRNIRVTGSPTGTTAHIQPTLAVNPRRPSRLFGVCFAWLDGYDHRNELAVYTSSDCGRTWTVGELPGSGALNDHGVVYGPDGVGYVWADDGLPFVWRTEDDGRTFGAPVRVGETVRIDRACFAADQSPSRGGHLYGVWSTDENEAVGFGRSTDGGRRFEPPRRIAHGLGAGAEWTVSPEVSARHGVVHAVYGIWPKQGESEGKPDEKPTRGEMTGPIMVVSSRDGGRTFGEPVQLGIGSIDILVTADTAGPAIPAVVVGSDPRVAAVVFTQRTSSSSGDLMLCTTLDGGRSWSSPRPITGGSSGTYYFHARLASDPAGGLALSVLRYNAGTVDAVLFTSGPGRPRFGPERTVTAQPFDPAIAPPGKNGEWWLGDTHGVAASVHAVHPIWTDTRNGHLEIFTAVVPRQSR